MVNEVNKTTIKNKIIKTVESLLYARRNNNIKLEQKYYDELREYCEKHNINFENSYDGAVNELKKRIAPCMNGIV
jgi:hypothetical protein